MGTPLADPPSMDVEKEIVGDADNNEDGMVEKEDGVAAALSPSRVGDGETDPKEISVGFGFEVIEPSSGLPSVPDRSASSKDGKGEVSGSPGTLAVGVVLTPMVALAVASGVWKAGATSPVGRMFGSSFIVGIIGMVFTLSSTIGVGPPGAISTPSTGTTTPPNPDEDDGPFVEPPTISLLVGDGEGEGEGNCPGSIGSLVAIMMPGTGLCPGLPISVEANGVIKLSDGVAPAPGLSLPGKSSSESAGDGNTAGKGEAPTVDDGVNELFVSDEGAGDPEMSAPFEVPFANDGFITTAPPPGSGVSAEELKPGSTGPPASAGWSNGGLSKRISISLVNTLP